MHQTASETVLVLDIGTSGARALAYDRTGLQLACSTSRYPTYYDRPAWAEQEPEDWWTAALAAMCNTIGQIAGRRVLVVGLTGQSPTIAPFDKDGRPLRRGLLYQDNRAIREADECCERLGGRSSAHRETGHDPAAFYIAPKVLWVRRHEHAVFAQTHVWLQPRDFVAWKLTGECATDWSHAGSTLLFDLRGRRWSERAFWTLDIPPSTFPKALPPWSTLGEVSSANIAQLGLRQSIPVVLGGADSQCCALGAGVLDSSQISDMAGTSTCLNVPVRQPIEDLRVANYCHVLPDWWCTELGLNATGASLQWLIQLLGMAGGAADFASGEAAASQAMPGCGGLIFLPYLADGERFDPALRGGFCGLSLRHQRGDLLRSVLEGTAFAIREHLDTMAEVGTPIQEMHVSGGGSRLSIWNQIKADVTGRPVISVDSDATALGVGILAAAGVGCYSSMEEAAAHWVRPSRAYEPDASLADLYAEQYARFRTLTSALSAPLR